MGVDSQHLVQLVQNYTPSKLKFPCIVQEKYDGCYCIALRDDYSQRCIIFSRTGKQYLSMKHLEGQLFIILQEAGTKYDLIIFEAYIPDIEQSIISGYCRDEKNQHPDIHAVIHDILTFNDYFGNIRTAYEKRYMVLQQAYSQFYFTEIHLPKMITAYQKEDIEYFANTVIQGGGEGVVIKHSKAGYHAGKRDYTLMKLKRKISYDLVVIDVQEGTGQFEGAVGALLCRYSNGRIISVGSGLTAQERKEFWQDKNKIIGRIVTVEAMRLTSSGLLREPIYKGVRYDKVKADF